MGLSNNMTRYTPVPMETEKRCAHSMSSCGKHYIARMLSRLNNDLRVTSRVSRRFPESLEREQCSEGDRAALVCTSGKLTPSNWISMSLATAKSSSS